MALPRRARPARPWPRALLHAATSISGALEPAAAMAAAGLLTVALASAAPVAAAAAAAAQGFVAQGGAPLVSPMPAGTVAVLEVELPDAAQFVLHATLPLPPGASTSGSFSIVEHDGARVPAQVQAVSRYAAPADGADVVELIARVRRPPGAPPGARRNYPVLRLTTPPPVVAPPPFPLAGLVLGPKDLPPSLFTLLGNAGGLRVQARDVFGHLYRLNLLGPGTTVTLLAHGAAHAEVKVAGTLMPVAPVGGPNGTLPHHVGVQAYLSTWAGEPVLGVDLRVHNAHDGGDGADPSDDPLGKLYFDSIELDLPAGFHVLESEDAPGTGAFQIVGDRLVWKLVEPLPGGELHLLPQQSHFHRRLAIAAYSDVARAQSLLELRGLGFARRGIGPDGQRLWSWWNPATSRWFPQDFLLPHLEHVGMQTVRNKLLDSYASTQAHYVAGTGTGMYPIVHPRMGWFHPWGIEYGGMTSGSEIHLSDGLREVESASREGVRHFQLLHTMHSDRQPNALFHESGRPTSLDDWLVPGPNPYLPFGFYMKLQGPNDPFGFDEAPTFQSEAVVAQGREPWYEATLVSYQPHDMQHLIRYTRSAKVLAWLTNDALAKDDLLMQAELVRLSYHRFFNNGSGFMDSTGLRYDMEHSVSWPGRGVDFGRGEGWGIDTVTTAYALGPVEWREKVYPWFMDVALTVAVAISPCNGHLLARVNNKMLDGKYRAAQSFEDSIVHNSLRGVVETAFRGRDAAYAKLLDDVLLLQYWAFVSPLQWNAQAGGPKDIYAIGPKEVSQGVWCAGSQQPADGFVPTVNTFQTFSTLGYAFTQTGHPLFLDRAAVMLGNDPLGKLLHPNAPNIENRAALLAVVQYLLGQL